ncbi:uncharacterized protein Z520_05120 [Fonsecaea multimorphosa CBS 102226]|uniref:3'(2'),5'-bisphosphate nucleotidase n=1 Tax=Fonsecaea multimorphosa CBS 102226 TaxID=1442371 RepID=A0A0D2K8N4_9EURO|nr:uncharacterized protein Z520_05120 [Fonsecaea multimorphosa CBS 102226]KIX99544.1 hypothetical protein Z520_05120 [Fonsecaea multimorphosa CBS 102226]OAL25535.1 hypothetical protein AYO22_04854 [Fonsecaea multimorphosa]
MRAPYSRERHVAELAVLRASILTKRVQSTVSEISKDDNSPVTVADFAAQALIISALRDAFPDDGFLGEEDAAALRRDGALAEQVYGLVSSAPEVAEYSNFEAPNTLAKPISVEDMLNCIDLGGRGTGGDKGRFWIMDPVDGTAAFVKGQQYGVALALIEDGREVVGVLGCPNVGANTTRISEDDVDRDGLGVMLTAVRGRGSTIRTMSLRGLGAALALSHLESSPNPEDLHIVDCVASTDSRHDVVAKLAHDFQTTLPVIDLWSLHIRYAALVVGGADVHFCIPTTPNPSRMHIWDHAGSQLIFTELGGKVTDLDGKLVDFGAGRDLNRNRGLVVAREGIHETLLAAVNKILLEA